MTPMLCCAAIAFTALASESAKESRMAAVRLIPYPQQVRWLPGRLLTGPARLVVSRRTAAVAVAVGSLRRRLPGSGTPVPVRVGSVEEGFRASWLSPDDVAWLSADDRSPEASVLRIDGTGITVVGRGRWGMVYGIQTVNQMLISDPASLPHASIRDWPDMRWRCLSPQMTWYSGYNRLEGYDCGNWTLDEWKWLVDWSMLHKCNAWAMCMYGKWPFTLPDYEETTLAVPSFRWNPATERKETYRFVHRNIRREFLPELIRYANSRGLKVHAYIGKNSFNGTYGLTHPEADAGGAAELIPFHPGVHEYWDAVVKRLLEIGFNGFVFEDPEALHVPNQNAECYRTFWEPWAETYGFRSVADTNANDPPLGVHVEYYTWLFRTFDGMIRRHAAALGRTDPEIYLISHILLSRMVSESKDQAERDRWFALIDEKQGRKAPFVILEADEAKYVSFLGADRVASLGGRGGSCTNAMRRIASVNNNWLRGGMGGDLAYERECQQRIRAAGGFGAMGYIFEWTNTEVFGYLAAQYLWRNSGVPGIDNRNQTGFLDHAYRLHYGDKVGRLVARAMDEGSCVNDAMMLDGVYGSQYPTTGAPLHRDYQYLAVLADRAVSLARKAYEAYTGRLPSLARPAYDQGGFTWSGFAAPADRAFKEERLRLLYVGCVRSRHMCDSVLAHRKAQALIAAGAPIGRVLASYDRAIVEARASERIYQTNYDDDYDWTDGLCAKVTETLVAQRGQFLASVCSDLTPAREWRFDTGDAKGWTKTHDLASPALESGCLVLRAAGPDPFVENVDDPGVRVGPNRFVEVRLNSSRPGRLRFFWATDADLARLPAGAYPFSEARVRSMEVAGGDQTTSCRLSPDWDGELRRIRIDIPHGAEVRVASIRILETPAQAMTPAQLAMPASEAARSAAQRPLAIPWERVRDIGTAVAKAKKPGLYLSVSLGFDARDDYFRLGVAFTVETRHADGSWFPLFRRTVGRRERGWRHYEIPVRDGRGGLACRFITDSYSRAQNRMEPSWRWAIWGRPLLVRIDEDGRRRIVYDFAAHAADARTYVRLDADGKDARFTGVGEDASGATFRATEAGPVERLRRGELRSRQWVDGFREWALEPPHRSPYRCWLGEPWSGWAYNHEARPVSWRTAPVAGKHPTAVAFIAGTGYVAGRGELWCNGRRLLAFDMAKPQDCRWEEDGVELRYLHGGDIRSETITYGISGVYVLLLPARLVTPGKALEMSVKLGPGSGDWFMVHEYVDTERETSTVVLPDPPMPAIAAFTPHRDGREGVTIGEFDVAPREVSGIYPHLCYSNDGGECGTGAVVP